MLAEGGVPELQRHETPDDAMQPLVPRYEAALAQLELAVKVREACACGAGPLGLPAAELLPTPLQEERAQKAV